MFSSLRIAILLVFGLIGASLHAQGGPPVITDDPGTPGNHRWEINVGFTQEKLLGETNFEAPLLDLNYGGMGFLFPPTPTLSGTIPALVPIVCILRKTNRSSIWEAEFG